MNVNEAIETLKCRWPQQSERVKRFQRLVLQRLAEGEPVTVDYVAQMLPAPHDLVESTFADLKRMGAEFDEDGRLVGYVLTLNPTSHRFRVGGRELYAWCALDTLILPAMVEQVATVESTCPVTGESIHLTVTPQGVESYSPAGAALSLVLDDHCTVGPQGTFCGRIFFFRSHEVAAQWASEQEDVGVFSVDDADRIARAVYIEPNEA